MLKSAHTTASTVGAASFRRTPVPRSHASSVTCTASNGVKESAVSAAVVACPMLWRRIRSDVRSCGGAPTSLICAREERAHRGCEGGLATCQDAVEDRASLVRGPVAWPTRHTLCERRMECCTKACFPRSCTRIHARGSGRAQAAPSGHPSVRMRSRILRREFGPKPRGRRATRSARDVPDGVRKLVFLVPAHASTREGVGVRRRRQRVTHVSGCGRGYCVASSGRGRAASAPHAPARAVPDPALCGERWRLQLT